METQKVKKRNVGKTTAGIVAAAQRHFTAYGYEDAKVRDIASDAGVDAALINRYFKSKKGLFEEAVIGAISIDEMLEVDKQDFGATMGGLMSTKDLEYSELDPTAAFVKSINSPNVGPLLAKMMDEEIVPKLASWLGGRDAEQRAALILAQMLGFEVFRRIAKVQSLNEPNSEVVAKFLAKSLQTYVDDG